MKKMIVPSLDYLLQYFEIDSRLPDPERAEGRYRDVCELADNVTAWNNYTDFESSTVETESFEKSRLSAFGRTMWFWIKRTDSKGQQIEEARIRIKDLERQIKQNHKQMKSAGDALRGI